MKRKKEIFILLLIIAALSLYLFFHKEDRTHYELPSLSAIDTEEITRLTIRKDDTAQELKKENDRWILLPQGFPADSATVEKMLEILAGLSLTALASEAGNDSIYDLDEAKRIRVAVFRDDTPLRTLDIGKAASSQRHTFVKLEDDKRIYHAAENFRNRFDKKVSDLRDKQVMKVEGEISELLLAKGDKSLRILRGAEPADVEPEQAQTEEEGKPALEMPKWQTDDGKTVKEKDVDTLIKTLSDLKCEGYVEKKTKLDFTNPSYTVTLKGLEDETLSVYEKQDGKFVCTSSQNDYVFLIPEWRAKKIQLDLDDLIEN